LGLHQFIRCLKLDAAWISTGISVERREQQKCVSLEWLMAIFIAR
jgi:hypothetical protein